MIASHAHRAIFVKTRKTAGTSIEIAFSAVCGDDDVITPLGPADEPLRTAAGSRGPQNFRRGEAGGRSRPWRKAPGAWNHMPATDIVRLLGRSTWDDYFTFAVERNPWDRAVSLFYFRSRTTTAMPAFGTFLRSIPSDRLSNWDLYALDGRVAVDRVLAYEELDADLAQVWSRLGVRPPEMGRAKGGFRPGRDYRSLYSDDDAQFVAQACRREIAAFGYTFDGT